MAENKKSQLDNLKKLAKLANVDIESAFEEIKQEIVERIKPMIPPTPPPAPAANVDMDLLTNRVIEALRIQQNAYIEKAVQDAETRIGIKLAEAFEEMQKVISLTAPNGESNIDSTAVVQGVVKILQPEIIKASQEAAERVFEVNSKAMADNINTQLTQRLEQMQPAAPEKPLMNFNLMSLLNPDTLSSIREIISLIKGTAINQQPDPSKRLKEVYELQKIINGLKLDEAGAEKLINAVTTTETTTT